MSKPFNFFTWLNKCEKCNSKMMGIEYKSKIVFKCSKCKQQLILIKENKNNGNSNNIK